VPELRNVIVFTSGGARYAVELRWIRDVVSLGFVTTVPTAPPAVSGVCNLHGTILPVLDLGPLLGAEPGPAARQGDGAIVLEVVPSDGTAALVCALRVDRVDHVASLPESGGAIVDVTGGTLVLLEPEHLVRRALELVSAPPSPAEAR
jgi:chemotaxis signal transduction protein